MATALPPLAAFTSLDWFLVLVAAVSVILAFSKGFVRVLFSLLGIVAGFLVASWNYVTVAVWLRQWIGSFAIAEMVAFVGLLGAVVVLFSLAAGFVRKGVAAVGLGVFDRLLGALLGLLRGLLGGAVAVTALVAFAPDSGWVKDSALAPYFLAGSHGLSSVVPRELQEQMAVGAGHLLQQSPELPKH